MSEALDRVMLVESKVLAKIQGAVTSDNKIIGVMVGNDQEGGDPVITIQVTHDNMIGYSSVLHSTTQGREILTKWLDILELENSGELMSLRDPGGCYYTATIFPSFFKFWDPGGSLPSRKVCFSLHHLEDKVILEGGGIDRDPTPRVGSVSPNTLYMQGRREWDLR